MKTEQRKCIICDKRFKVQEWKVAFERAFCVTCQCRFKVAKEKKILTPRFARIIELRYGYIDGKTH